MSDWGDAARRGVALAAAGLLAAAIARAESAAPDTSIPLGGHPVRNVRLEIRDVFDPVPEGRLGPIYRLANGLHVRSRESTVRPYVLFEAGDRWSERRARQQERVLRSVEFLQPDRVQARWAGDSVDVRIGTRDEWTTQPVLNIERGGGLQFGTFGLAERNLLGLGKSLSGSYSDVPTGTSRALEYGDPAVFGTRVRFRYGASHGTSGANDLFALELPFLHEDAPFTWGVSWMRTGSRAHLFEYGEEIATFDRDIDDIQTWFGVGRRDDGLVRRVMFSFQALDRVFGASSVPPGGPSEFNGGNEDQHFRRVTVELRLWRPQFLERPGVDRPDFIEDVDVGPSASLRIGVSPESFGGTAGEGFLEARLDFGGETAGAYSVVRTGLSTRLRGGALETVRHADARCIVQPGARHALVAAALGAAGTKVPRDFQLVAGGLNGLRAFPVHQLSGRELVRFNVEERARIVTDVGGLFSLGFATFWDAARAWGPGAVGTVWHHDAGFGVRVAPRSAAYGQVIRVDVAWPLSPTRDGQHEAVFSFGSTQAF